MAVYATVPDMQARYDWREIGDLISDTPEPVSANLQLSDPNLALAIADASGEIDAALLACGRYSSTDLSGLSGNTKNHLTRICCQIAIAFLYERKPFYNTDKLEAYSKAKERHLKKLSTGINILNLPLVVAAGTPEASGPTSVDYYPGMNLATDPARMHYFPARSLPFGRQLG